MRKVVQVKAFLFLLICIVMAGIVIPVAARPTEYWYEYKYATTYDYEELYIDESDHSLGKVRLIAQMTLKYTYKVTINGRHLIRVQWYRLQMWSQYGYRYWDIAADWWRIYWMRTDMDLWATIRNSVTIRYDSGLTVYDGYLDLYPGVVCYVWDVARCYARYDGARVVDLQVAFIYR
ncbi:MAG: hypothetical protein ACFFFC_15910 [Candidatus Thorarchaeota archaeon]